VQEIPVAKIRWDCNIRSTVDESQIDGLAQSMSQVGQLMPIRVRRQGEQYEGIDGMRRWLAAQRLNWGSIDAIVESDNLQEAECLLRQLISNCQREEIPIMDRARGVGQLLGETGWNQSEACRRLGFKAPAMSSLLTLLELPKELQALIESRRIAPSTAIELSKESEPARYATLLQSASNGTLRRDAVTAKARRSKGKRTAGGRRVSAILDKSRSVIVSGVEPSLDALIDSLEEALGRARKARSQGLSLDTFTKLLRDTAASKGGTR
jgi:ParB/RepB/Spo0J family partition protein